MSTAAVTARRDQLQAELRDLVGEVRKHQPECAITGGCPGPVWRVIAGMRPEHARALLIEAVTKLARGTYPP